MRRATERIERAQLLTASARERAMELAQKYKEGDSTAHEGGDAAALQIIVERIN
jgi:hypothetical protein